VKQLLSRALIPSKRAEFCARFGREMFRSGSGAMVRKETEQEICNTLVRWVREGFDMQADPQQLTFYGGHVS
jgi:hypothetical protein